MTDSWLSALAARGARIDGGAVESFGDPPGEREAARAGSVVADLSHLGILAVGGDGARGFLQSQLTCDVASLGAASNTLGAYCSPQGRVLASFLLWPTPAWFVLVLARELAPPIAARLRKFVLRAKVAVADRSGDFALLGLAGPAAGDALASAIGVAPPAVHGVACAAAATAIALPGARFIAVADAAAAPGVWDALARALRPVGTPCWRWLDIRDGIPLVTAATTEAFVPQMLNLELVGGVSFRKGCYPGQEVVARTQYLGKTKRRMFRAALAAAAAPGDSLCSEDLGDQASGTVVTAAPSPDGGFEVLAVAPVASMTAGVVHLRSLTGPLLRVLPLPYPVA